MGNALWARALAFTFFISFEGSSYWFVYPNRGWILWRGNLNGLKVGHSFSELDFDFHHGFFWKFEHCTTVCSYSLVIYQDEMMTKAKTKVLICSCIFWNRPVTNKPIILCGVILRQAFFSTVLGQTWAAEGCTHVEFWGKIWVFSHFLSFFRDLY